MADAERLRGELYAFKNRADVLARVRELRTALGVPEADIAWQPRRDGCCHLHVRPGRR